MFQNKRIFALIPARSGSKGIKNKNIVLLSGKPLISYVIEAARESAYIDDVVVTTDSDRIAAIARGYGAETPFIRPAELAKDTSKTVEAVVHAIGELNRMGRTYDVMVLLQPTQPLTTGEDIDRAVETFFENEERALASVSEVRDHPLLIRSVEDRRLIPLLPMNSTCRRQDMPRYYRVNGCLYINRVSEIDLETSFNDNTLPFIMSKEHSVDIDEMSDLCLAEYYINWH